jgi:hypothetical protein
MTDLKLTPWFPPHIKPVYEGVYQVWHPTYGGNKYRWVKHLGWHHGALICNHEFQNKAEWRGVSK